MEAVPEVDPVQMTMEAQRQYADFIDDVQGNGKYSDRIKTLVDERDIRFTININDLRRKYPYRTAKLLKNGPEELAALQAAIKDAIINSDGTYGKKQNEFFVGFEGSFGNKHVTPRTLTSKFLGNLVCVEGIVTKCSLSKLKVVKSVHYCPSTKKLIERKYEDLTSTDGCPTVSVYPTKDDAGNLLETEYGLSKYKDHQTLTIQEMPEKAPAGQLPRSVDIICDNDLVDICKPGDRVQVVGVYRCLPGKHGGFTTGVFRTVILANSIAHLTVESDLEITRDDMNRCKRLARRSDIFDLLSRSLAPSIHGHEYVKKAILCLLLGGAEKVLSNGTRLRGDVNVLLLGDPSVAKSQLLRYVLQTAPRAVATTGRGSSGVGLTAAVTTDLETGERRLEAGAMILADRGVVCIDEFDKMSDLDRTAIHEVMEQGKVTIAKAGIHARLNARCSVLAAANPVYGRYDQYKTPMENIGLQDSLLSRFDLLFVLLDLVDAEDDGRIAEHVVRMHRYRNPKEQDGDVLSFDTAADMLATKTNVPEEEVLEVFEKYDPLLHGESRSVRDKVISLKFMRKYVLISKNLKTPKLTEEACNLISEEYSRLRSQDVTHSDIARTQPITARTLETLIRLSTAHAKARFSRAVEGEDASAAIELVQFAIFHKVLEKEKKKKRVRDESDDENDLEAGTGEADGQEQRPKRTRQASQASLASQAPLASQASQVDEFENFQSQESAEIPTLAQLRELTKSRQAPLPPIILPDRLDEFRQGIVKVFMSTHEKSIPKQDLIKHLKELSLEFTDSEMKAGILSMAEDNQIMESDDVIFLI